MQYICPKLCPKASSLESAALCSRDEEEGEVQWLLRKEDRPVGMQLVRLCCGCSYCSLPVQRLSGNFACRLWCSRALRLHLRCMQVNYRFANSEFRMQHHRIAIRRSIVLCKEHSRAILPLVAYHGKSNIFFYKLNIVACNSSYSTYF